MQESVLGDSLLASASVTYLGPFTPDHRISLLKSWTKAVRRAKIDSASQFSLTKTLGEPGELREWSTAGLPDDTQLVENAVIMSRASRYPLMIDPQEAASSWLRTLLKDR